MRYGWYLESQGTDNETDVTKFLSFLDVHPF